jgi:hypothetical protein
LRLELIALYSNDSEIVNFNMVGPDPSNPYTIKGITGLDAEEIIPKYYASGTISGSKFNDLVLGPREVGILIDLKPNYRLSQHPADLRGTLMKAIASSRTGEIQLRFIEGGVCWGAIKGFVTKFEAPVSSKSTEVKFTMRCDDPIIRSLTVTSQVVDDLSFSEPLLIDPISTSPHGFKFKITFTANTVLPFAITDHPSLPDWYFQINYLFETGDELYFSSESNDKYLYRIRSAVTLNLADLLDLGSIWPMLFPGENQLYFFTLGFDWDEVFWYETHWGI